MMAAADLRVPLKVDVGTGRQLGRGPLVRALTAPVVGDWRRFGSDVDARPRHNAGFGSGTVKYSCALIRRPKTLERSLMNMKFAARRRARHAFARRHRAAGRRRRQRLLSWRRRHPDQVRRRTTSVAIQARRQQLQGHRRFSAARLAGRRGQLHRPRQRIKTTAASLDAKAITVSALLLTEFAGHRPLCARRAWRTGRSTRALGWLRRLRMTAGNPPMASASALHFGSIGVRAEYERFNDRTTATRT